LCIPSKAFNPHGDGKAAERITCSKVIAIASEDPLYKRLLDLSILFAAHVLLSPIWVLLWIFIPLFIWREDGTPIFYVQERSGLNEKPFRALKFRSMMKGAEKGIGALYGQRKTTQDDKVRENTPRHRPR
jgi:lipopolysaccharide/colanic/teichoic acid biosynthesis glycosyltransferase